MFHIIYGQSREILCTFKITINKLTYEIYSYLVCLMYFSYCMMLCLLLNITQSINRRVYQTLFLCFSVSVLVRTPLTNNFNNTSFAGIWILVWYTSPIDAVFYWLLNIKQSIRRRVYQTLFLFPLCCPPLQTNNIIIWVILRATFLFIILLLLMLFIS